jgi:hypothetical protein
MSVTRFAPLLLRRKWETLSQTNFDLKQGNVSIKWFVEGETNMCYNCLDRHVEAGHGDQVILVGSL